jgi:hypothetical protein
LPSEVVENIKRVKAIGLENYDSFITSEDEPSTDFKWQTCSGTTIPAATSDIFQELMLGGQTLEVIKNFCYLGELVGQAGGCSDATGARVQSAEFKFRKLRS